MKQIKAKSPQKI